jgi:hypothetical protein
MNQENERPHMNYPHYSPIAQKKTSSRSDGSDHTPRGLKFNPNRKPRKYIDENIKVIKKSIIIVDGTSEISMNDEENVLRSN